MRFLLSSLCLLLVGCVSYPKKQGYIATKSQANAIVNPYFSDTAKDYVYKSSIDVFGRSFGGILVIKKVGQNQHRIVFTTEIGNTLFDFSLANDGMAVNRIIEELDRKILINVLRKDFTALVRERISGEAAFEKEDTIIRRGTVLGNRHYYIQQDSALVNITRTARGKEKVVFRFSGISDNIAQHIEIQHKNIPLYINLKAF